MHKRQYLEDTFFLWLHPLRPTKYPTFLIKKLINAYKDDNILSLLQHARLPIFLLYESSFRHMLLRLINVSYSYLLSRCVFIFY